jgi:hypothetical protein
MPTRAAQQLAITSSVLASQSNIAAAYSCGRPVHATPVRGPGPRPMQLHVAACASCDRVRAAAKAVLSWATRAAEAVHGHRL